MNKVMKKLLCACLALAMLITIIPPVTAEAATKTEKMTLYKGETVEITAFYGIIKSVSSSKKSVASVKKKSGKAVITAKKSGKATVSVKTNRGSFKYVITVKKLDITVKLTDMGKGYMLLTVKNNTKQTFTQIAVDYVLKNDQGATFKTDTTTVSDVVAGKTVYDKIYYDNYNYTVDAAKCSAKVVGDSRSLMAKYKNVTSKIKTSKTEKDGGNGILEIVFKTKNTQKKDSAYVTHYVLIYDSNNQVIGLTKDYEYLKAGKMDTGSVKAGTYYYGDAYDHYKVVTVAYSTIY